MNFTDIIFLKWKDIISNRLIYTRKKTNERFNIGLHSPAVEILKHYESQDHTKNDYVFPLLSTNYNTPQSMFNRKVKMLREVNKSLKAVGKLAGIDSVLTTYVARHSYATNMKKSGISTSIICQALGHQNEKTTQVYLESFENSVLDEANKAIL